MPINEYDTSERPGYVSSYVPRPLEYLQGIAKNMQGEYDTGLHATDSFNKIAAAIKASPVGEGIKQNLISSFNKDKENLYNSTKSYSSPEFQKNAMDLVNKYANHPAIERLNAEKELFDQNQKRLQEGNSDLNYTYHNNYDPKTGNYSQAKSLEELPLAHRVTKYADANKEGTGLMSNIASSSYGYENAFDFQKGMSVGPGGETVVYNKRTGKTEKITPQRVNEIATVTIPAFANSEAGTFELQKMLLPVIGDNAYQLNYTKLSNLAASGDPQAIKYKEAFDNYSFNHLRSLAEKQIFNKTEQGIKEHFITDRQAEKANDDKEINTQLNPMQELPPSNPGDITNQDALNVFGLGKNLDISGNFDYGKFNINPTGATPLSVKGGSRTNIQPNNQKTTTETNEQLVEHYTGLVNTAKRLGIQIPYDGKTKDGKFDKINYNKLQDIITKVGKNYLINGQTGQGLQTELSNNMSSYYLGKYDKEGEFKESPFLQTSKITEIGTNQQIVDDEAKSSLAQNGVIKDINFYAENPGTFVLTSNDGVNTKNYNVYLGEVHSKELTRPMWRLTQSFDKSIKGLDPKSPSYKEDLKYVEEAKKLQNKEILRLSNLYQNVQNPELKQVLDNNVKTYLVDSENTKTTGADYSAELTKNGTPKYTFIGKQIINPYTGEPINKVVVINNETGSITLDDLNNTQAKESSYIQSVIKGGYKPKENK